MSSPPDAADLDVVVVGSGFGGAAAAKRLALAGKRVLVLERGPWRDSLPVRSMGIERWAPFPCGAQALTHLIHSLHLGRLNLRLNRSGLYELFAFRGLNVMVGSGVGGGSLAYGGLLQPPRCPALWRGLHPELDPASIERYYDKVITDMGGVRLSREHAVPQSIWTQLPDAPGRRCQPADIQPHMGARCSASREKTRKVMRDDPWSQTFPDGPSFSLPCCLRRCPPTPRRRAPGSCPEGRSLRGSPGEERLSDLPGRETPDLFRAEPGLFGSLGPDQRFSRHTLSHQLR